MNKLVTFTLGSIVAAAGIGAAAVSFPGLNPSVSVQADVPANAYPQDVSDYKIKWLPDEKAMLVSFVIPDSAPCYGDENASYKYTTVDKLELYQCTQQNYGGVVIATLENVPVGECVIKDTQATPGTRYSYKVKYYLGDKSNGNYFSSPYADAGLMPSAVTDLKYTTNKGTYPVEVTGVAPKLYRDGVTEINEPISVRAYSQEYDPITYQQVVTEFGKVEGIEPGAPFSFTITEGLKESGLSNLQLVTRTSDGEGDVMYLTILLGDDYPGLPQNLSAKENEDGSLTLIWDAPGAARGGYFDPAATRYNVLMDVNDTYDFKTIGSNLEETSFTYTPQFDRPTRVKFAVEAFNDVQVNYNRAELTLVLGPACELPFTEGFNVEKASNYGNVTYAPENVWTNSSTALGYPKTWNYSRTSYLNREQITTPDGTGGMAMIYYYEHDATPVIDYLTSSKVNVDGEGELELSFNYLPAPGFTNILAGEISFDGGEFIEVCRGEFKDAPAMEWTTASGTVEVPDNARSAVLRIASYNGVGAGITPTYAHIDNIKLRSTDALAVIYPASVSNFGATYDTDKNTILVSMTAPSTTHPTLGDMNGAKLDYITRIELWRQAGSASAYEMVHTFDNPTPGEDLTWEDTELGVGGYYYYKAITYVENRCDYGEFLLNPVLVGQIPAEVNDLTATSNEGDAPITVKWTAPSLDKSDNELKAIIRMTLTRRDFTSYTDELLMEYVDVEPGTAMEYVDNDVEKDMSYEYKVVCFGTAGSNFGTGISISTKDDSPATPQNVKATLNEDGSVTVTWNPVTEGQNNGYLNLANLTYTVYRGIGAQVYSANEAQVIAEGLTEATFTDSGFDFEENVVKYFIQAICNEQESYFSNAATALAGKPLAMPVVEHFAGGQGYQYLPDYAWITEGTNVTSSVSNWSFYGSAYTGSSNIDPLGGADDRGLAYCFYGSWATDVYDDYLTSSHIALEGGETPVISFSYYSIPNYDSELAVAVSFDGSEFEKIWEVCYKDLTTEGWEKVYAPADVPEGAKLMQVRFISHKGPRSCAVIIDEVSIFDLPAPVLDSEEETRNLVWTVDPSEHIDLAGFHVYCDGERKNETMLESTTASHPSDPSIVGNYTVTALYDKGQIESAHSNAVRIRGINGIEGAELTGIIIRTEGGNAIVEGAEGMSVTITNPAGATVYAGEGNCKVALTPATYIVKVGAAPAVKLFVR